MLHLLNTEDRSLSTRSVHGLGPCREGPVSSLHLAVANRNEQQVSLLAGALLHPLLTAHLRRGRCVHGELSEN